MMKPKANTAKTAKRLLSYIISWYKATFAAVLFCIFVSAGATVASSLFLKTLVDGYITPLLTTGSTDFSGLLRSILTVGVIYLCGVLGTLLYNQLMVKVSQGTLLRRSHVLVVCGHSMTEAMKNDIAVAQRLGITATTLEGILTVKGQGRR